MSFIAEWTTRHWATGSKWQQKGRDFQVSWSITDAPDLCLIFDSVEILFREWVGPRIQYPRAVISVSKMECVCCGQPRNAYYRAQGTISWASDSGTEEDP